jgi:hypothetical protein
MSNPFDPRTPPPPGQKRPVILSILMFLFGLILLLPGVCAVIFAGVAFSGSGSGFDQFILLWVICLAISFGGIMLIVKAFR